MRHTERGTTLRKVLWAVVFVLAMVSSGCGLAADGVNHLRAVQLDPGDLYSPEFYRTATPDDVRRAIGGKSLAGESFTERFYAANTEGRGFLSNLDGALRSARSVFIPTSSVESASPLYPLRVALDNTPYPEVIAVMLDAGAVPEMAGVARYAAGSRADPAIVRILLDRSSAKTRCRTLAALAARGDRELVDYCLALSDVGPDTGPDTGPACVVDGTTPFTAAVAAGQNGMAAYLRSLGAGLPEDGEKEYQLLTTVLRRGNPDGFRLLLEMGADPSRRERDGGNYLLNAAFLGGITDEAVLMHLGRTIPLDGENGPFSLNVACRTGNMKLVDILLKRMAGLPEEPGARPRSDGEFAVPKGSPDAEAIRALLEARGFSVRIR